MAPRGAAPNASFVLPPITEPHYEHKFVLIGWRLKSCTPTAYSFRCACALRVDRELSRRRTCEQNSLLNHCQMAE
jgi:hypothetical protein